MSANHAVGETGQEPSPFLAGSRNGHDRDVIPFMSCYPLIGRELLLTGRLIRWGGKWRVREQTIMQKTIDYHRFL